MIMTTPAITGSISTGTLLPGDLIPAFHAALIALGGKLPESEWETFERFEDGTIPHTFEDDYHDRLLETLESGIDALLPLGWRFGAHEGDGADIGIWEVEVED
jgi:hypothetical protein